MIFLIDFYTIFFREHKSVFSDHVAQDEYHQIQYVKKNRGTFICITT